MEKVIYLVMIGYESEQAALAHLKGVMEKPESGVKNLAFKPAADHQKEIKLLTTPTNEMKLLWLHVKEGFDYFAAAHKERTEAQNLFMISFDDEQDGKMVDVVIDLMGNIGEIAHRIVPIVVKEKAFEVVDRRPGEKQLWTK